MPNIHVKYEIKAEQKTIKSENTHKKITMTNSKNNSRKLFLFIGWYSFGNGLHISYNRFLDVR